MSDWQVGDIAICVDDGPCSCGGCGGMDSGLFAGNRYRVLGVTKETNRRGMSWLSLDVGLPDDGFHSTDGADAARFRKIRPDQHEPCEEEFVTPLNRTKRTVRA